MVYSEFSSDVKAIKYGTFSTAKIADESSITKTESPKSPSLKFNFGGSKTIGYIGSFALLVNNAVGPAELIIPLLNQTAGWASSIFWLVAIYIISTLSCAMLCEVIQKIPGNQGFTKRIEFCDAVRHYLGENWYWGSQIALAISLQASNIAAMIVSAQVLDNFFTKMMGYSSGFDWYNIDLTFTNAQGLFETKTVISIGFLTCCIICIPFGYLSLEDNMGFQLLSFWCLILFTIEFFFQFTHNIIEEPTTLEPYVDDNSAQANLLGTIIFVNAFVVTLPSWLNEKSHSVDVTPILWESLGFATIFRIAIGLFGGLAYCLTIKNCNGTRCQKKHAANILNSLAGPKNWEITQYSSFIWDVATLIPGIPVLAVVMKYNLASGKILSPRNAFIFAVIFPWIVTAFCYESSALASMCAWAGLCVQGYINFAVPVYLYIKSLQQPFPESLSPEKPVHALPKHWKTRTKYIIAWSILIFFVVICTLCIIRALLF